MIHWIIGFCVVELVALVVAVLFFMGATKGNRAYEEMIENQDTGTV